MKETKYEIRADNDPMKWEYKQAQENELMQPPPLPITNPRANLPTIMYNPNPVRRGSSNQRKKKRKKAVNGRRK